MARPLRIELAGALYHATSRGDGWDVIILGNEDRQLWLDVLGHVCKRFNWVVHALSDRESLSPSHRPPPPTDSKLSQGTGKRGQAQFI